MKMNRTLAVAVAATLAFSAAPVMADSVAESAVQAVEGADSLEGLKWSDYAILIDGVKFSVPMTYGDLEALGWTSDEDLSTLVSPNSYVWANVKQGKRQMTVDFLNLDINSLPISECIVASIALDDYYWPVDDGVIELPSGIVRGKSTIEDVKAAYGEPSDSYESDVRTELTYSTDTYEEIKLEFDVETGVLTKIDLENMVEPEGFTLGEVSEEVPESVAAYTKPEALSTDLSVYQIKVEDQVYELPVTVQALMDDGWELRTNDTDAYLAAHYFGWVTLQKGGQQIRAIARNYEDYAVLPENGWIEGLDFGKQDTDLPAEIPGGISIGMSKDDFVAALDATGVEYTVDGEDGEFPRYSFCNEDYGHGYIVTVYQGESTYDPNTVLTIEVENQKD